MKNHVLLGAALAACISFTSCDKNDPELMANDATVSSNSGKQSESVSASSDDMLNIVKDVSFTTSTVLATSDVSQSSLPEAWAHYEENSGVELRVHFTDFGKDSDNFAEWEWRANSNFSETQDEEDLASQYYSTVTGATPRAYQLTDVASITFNGDMSNLTHTVGADVFDLDMTYLDFANDVAGWIYTNSDENVTKVMLAVNGQYGVIVECPNTTEVQDIVDLSSDAVERLDQYMASI